MEYIKLTDTPAKACVLAKQTKTRFSSSWYVNKKFFPGIYIDSIIDQYKNNNLKIREDWENVKDDIMRKVVYQKFSNNYNLKQLLLETGMKNIIENSPRDDYWGIGKNGNGKNMLGIILMEVRQAIREQLPGNNCNSITHNMRIIVGSTPEIDLVLKHGTHIIVNLKQNEDDIKNIIPKTIQYIHFPIIELNIPNRDNFESLFTYLFNEYNKGAIIYIYSDKGCGRTSIFSIIFISRLYSLTSQESIRRINLYHKQRLNKEYQNINLPECEKQYLFIKECLNI